MQGSDTGLGWGGKLRSQKAQNEEDRKTGGGQEEPLTDFPYRIDYIYSESVVINYHRVLLQNISIITEYGPVCFF